MELNKEQRTKDKEQLVSVTEQIKRVLDEMNYPELQGLGISIETILGVKINEENESGYSKEEIQSAVEKLMKKSGGDDTDFASSYTTLILILHMAASIHIYEDFLQFIDEQMNGKNNDSSTDEEK